MTEKENSNQQEQPPIAVNTQYIKDLSLEIPFAPEIFREMNNSPEIDIQIDVDAKHLSENAFNVEIKLAMNADINEKKLFILELNYASVVTLNIPKEHIEPILLVEIPRIMFPFVRSIVTNTLVDGGLPPFMLNPIDFAGMYAARQEAKYETKN